FGLVRGIGGEDGREHRGGACPLLSPGAQGKRGAEQRTRKRGGGAIPVGCPGAAARTVVHHLHLVGQRRIGVGGEKPPNERLGGGGVAAPERGFDEMEERVDC